MTTKKIEELIHYYQRNIELLDIVLTLQRRIAGDQVTVLTLLRKLNYSKFEKIANELEVRHIVKFRPDKCQFCGILVEGAYEYLRSQNNSQICTACDDTRSATKAPRLPMPRLKSRNK